MLEDFQYDHPSKIFHGVRFALLGFDPITKSNVSSKLVDGGGVDVGQYGPICTHLIVHNLIYDDPICVVARNDGKTLVTGLWVAHSLDLGMPVDPTSVLYRPLIDFKGIPGAKSLVVCLTGYFRQDRDDIMTMVHLMGANFSKPLVANKVTHLVCYKFEGEKYELAKKTKKINLVNHLWLEDCLKAWELLPEAEYNRSGYELELEAEAKDSEEEMDIATKPFQPFNPKQELQRNLHDSSASKNVSHVISTNNDVAFSAGNDRKSDQELNAPKVIDTRDSAAFRDVSCGEGAKSCERTPAASMANGLPFSARSERSLHSDASKLSPKSYLRRTPRETTPSMYSGEMTGNLNTVQTVNAGKSNVSCFGISSMTEKLTDETDFGLKILKESVLHHEKQRSLLDEKQNMDISFGSSKSQKGGLNLDAHISGGAVKMSGSDKLKPNLLISDNVEVNKCLSNNVIPFSSLTAPMSSPNRSLAEVSKYQSSSASKKLPTSSSPIPLTVTSEISQDGNLEDALTSAGSKKVSLASKPENRDATIGQEHCTGEAQTISSPQTKNTSSRSKIFEIEKSNGTSTYKSYADAHSTPPTRKMFSRRSWSKGKTHFSTNLQGFLCLNKILSEEDSAISSTLGEETAGHKKLEKVSAEVNPSTVINTETYNVSQSRNKDHQKSMTIDDETGAPEEKETEFREAVTDEKYKDVPPDIMVYDDKSEDLQTKKATFQVHSHSMSFGEDTITEGNKTTCGKRKLYKPANILKALKSKRRGKREPLSKIKKTTIPFEAPVDEEKNEVQRTVNEETCKEVESHLESVAEHKSEAYNTALGVESHKTSGEDRNGPKQKRTTYAKRKLGESTHMDNDLKNTLLKEKCSKIEKKLVPLSKSTNLKEAVSEEAENDKNAGSVPHLAGKVKRNESTKDFYISNEVDKQSMPIHTDDQNARQGKTQVRKLAPINSSSKTDMEASKPNLERGQVQMSLQHEPACFILTALKLQRKEFQQVIKRLRGKVCRDSHQWSYQATHLIVADPIRRTEKFFAAAASGRWILKTDYLIYSSQAGKFLAEEPYEWHKSGLSEDGAINMEAPRKWRLHREKTGHGAFHGMNIVIYGECIAPSLETLKRVLKAGEGKILATSPPYTRFLKSRVDFAVVSPGILHVDIWIQEFLRHEIPCVVADYLVEFVCKPGHTLDRHVLYNSHALAEKALKNLMSRSEASNETPPSHGGDCDQPSVEVMTPPNDSDIQCQVCGSRDRGDEMLICGDDSGSNGCGVGMHFDCSVPPMADVPVDDWFCPNCSKSKNSKKLPKTAKKRTLV